MQVYVCWTNDRFAGLTREQLGAYLSNADLKRLEQYARNMVDHHLITDLLPTVARLFFTGLMADEAKLNAAQSAIVLGVGLQHKSVDVLSKELDLPVNQLLAMFNKAMRKFSDNFNSICESAIEQRSRQPKEYAKNQFQPTPVSLQDDLNDAAEEIEQRQERDRKKVREEISVNLKQFAIRGTEDDWVSALNDIDLKATKSGLLSVKSQRKNDKGAADIEKLTDPSSDPKAKRKRKRKSFKDQ
uniref:Possible tRNA binding domain-containing protein n=1 Tax=Plectus sambesii TaxID=2011161 RepID=A0A914UPD7_9BILA